MFRRGLINTRFIPRLNFQQTRFISSEIKEAINLAINSTPVVLFMKGTPEFPQCGFSKATIQTLGQQGVDPQKFAAYNVLEDNELRDGIKEFSSWPTIPQLYVNGEFVGGCDIILNMAQNGELNEFLEKEKVLIPEDDSVNVDVKQADIKPNRD
ncbi:GRX5 [Candida pseudojiufengensis]|uniref:GRX5 n=1 Tax=Candida pseudojiufengensis TaxID=497109 RepID=UPI002224EB8C|nr:GRX5 [Candida pseudojiufengensis]KAI5963246.1 GRX5 [Candida pseudojiufengensis]